MGKSTEIENAVSHSRSSWSLPVLLAFFAIYVIWGSTYLAIRVLVATVPPLFSAGLRFAIAGTALYLWARMRGVPAPTRQEWRNLWLLGVLMFLVAYGGLFWAEKRIPSGIASVLVATIPVWTSLFEIVVFKKEKWRISLIVAIGLGLAGVGILASTSGAGKLSMLGCLAILAAEISWSFGTVVSKNVALPESKVMSASGQMMTGGVMLLASSAAARELSPFPHLGLQAGAALGYLIVAGSLLAFTAYVWLLGRMAATKVASYAYVNPVIALAIGYWFGGEPFTARTLFGAILVLTSVVLLLGKFQRSSAKISNSTIPPIAAAGCDRSP
jgi:drug/metabolite transporter (DMT)-like permease